MQLILSCKLYLKLKVKDTEWKNAKFLFISIQLWKVCRWAQIFLPCRINQPSSGPSTFLLVTARKMVAPNMFLHFYQRMMRPGPGNQMDDQTRRGANRKCPTKDCVIFYQFLARMRMKRVAESRRQIITGNFCRIWNLFYCTIVYDFKNCFRTLQRLIIQVFKLNGGN